MVHAFQIIDCKNCGESYCPVCKDQCPACGVVDEADRKTMAARKRMKSHMHNKKLPQDK